MPHIPAVAFRLALLFIACCLIPAGSVQAQQRNPLQTIGHSVADDPALHYRFESFTVASEDGKRRWRVRLGIPLRDAPEAGFASFWMLDGNGALIEFDQPLLQELAAQSKPQVLVFLGYDNDLRIDSPARARDYTFISDTLEGDDTGAREGGGANAFLEIIERRIRPEVARRIALDGEHETLWGHSLAGLFVLHTLYTRTGLFDVYAAGSPSLWWRQGAMLGEPEREFVAHNAGQRTRLILSLGGGEKARDVSNRDMSNPRVLAHLKRVSGAPSDATQTLAERFVSVPGLDVDYREFDGLTHGLMFRASLMDALHRVAGVTDRSGTPRPEAPPTP